MPPHEGDDHGAPDVGLPVRHRLLRPGAIATGCALAAVAAVLAQFRAVFAGLVWDDRVFLLEDPRVRSIGSVWRAFGEAYFTPEHATEMYRPLVNASLAIDWALSFSTAGAPRTWWFHGTNLLLHAANAALVYLLFVNLTKRRLGAPLIAAVLFAMHPLAVEPVTWIVGRCDLLAALCGLLSAILLLRSPGKPRLLWASVAIWGLGLFAKASLATLPVIVAAGLVAYHGVEPRRLVAMRSLRRFSLYAIPAVIWFAARWAVLGAPFPVDAGRVWGEDVGFLDRAQGVGRAVFVMTSNAALPARLAGDYAGDVAWRPQTVPWDLSSVLGLAVLGVCVVLGVRLLRRHAAGFPLLAYALALVPVLQFVPIGAIFADRFLYLPMAFLLLLVAEGLEHLYYRWGALLGLTPTIALFVLLPILSWRRGAAWTDEPTFFRDVVAQYPAAPDARYRLAKALSATGRAQDRDEAKAILAEAIDATDRPDADDLALLGAIELEEGDLALAETTLRRAVAAAGGARLGGALTRYNLAVCLKRQGRAEEAIPLLEEALRRVPSLDAARTLLRSLR